MDDLKICTKCHQAKSKLDGFYHCSGKMRSECKRCTVWRNVRYQRRVQSWKYRYGDDDTRRTYMRDYYSKNKERFAKYRSDFKERHPSYYKDYHRMKLVGHKRRGATGAPLLTTLITESTT